MKPITLKDFDSLSKRDFDNGAVLDAIAEALKEREQHSSELDESEREMVDRYVEKTFNSNWHDSRCVEDEQDRFWNFYQWLKRRQFEADLGKQVETLFSQPDDEELVDKIMESLGQFVNLKGQLRGRDAFKKELRTLLRNRMATEEELRWLDKIIAYYRTFKEGLDYSESREISKFRESIRKKLSGEQGG